MLYTIQFLEQAAPQLAPQLLAAAATAKPPPKREKASTSVTYELATMNPRRFLLAAAIAVGSAFAAAPAVWTFYPLSDPMARCLDGSQAGYYLGPAAARPTAFLMHMQGGGWCTSLDDCAARAGMYYGTSTVWTKTGTCPVSSGAGCC